MLNVIKVELERLCASKYIIL